MTNNATLNSGIAGDVRILFNCTTSSSRLCPSGSTIRVGSWPYDIDARDLNNDSRVDLVISNEESDSVSVLLNATAPGSVQHSFSRTDYAVGDRPKTSAIADFNGDCRPDVVVSNHQYNTIPVLSLLINNGNSSFRTESINTVSTLQRGISPVIFDSNKDFIPDLVFLGAGSNKVFSLVNKTPKLGCF